MIVAGLLLQIGSYGSDLSLEGFDFLICLSENKKSSSLIDSDGDLSLWIADGSYSELIGNLLDDLELVLCLCFEL